MTEGFRGLAIDIEAYVDKRTLQRKPSRVILKPYECLLCVDVRAGLAVQLINL